jgi:carotenoid 1,2-hydratase
MSEIQDTKSTGSILFSSSLKDDVWHRQTGRNAFESWHFDALSDDGREALVIAFYDNYPFSPRYFQHGRIENGGSAGDGGRFPAISFTYSVDGKVVLRSVNEYNSSDFSAGHDGIDCSIGVSSFRVDEAEYGSGYILQIDLLTMRKRRIKAELEWLSVEADLLEATAGDSLSAASWNIVAPRSDVSGRITLVGRRGKTRKVIHFRGTGYHDHFRSASSLEETTGARCWGRAHFVDSTAIFQHLAGDENGEDSSNLFLVRDGSMHERDTQSELQNPTRSLFGLKVPRRLSFVSDDNIRLRVKPVKVIQSGFFEVKMLSEITLMLRDGKPRKTFGITEFTAPGRMKNSLYRWLSDLRIGRNGNSPLF